MSHLVTWGGVFCALPPQLTPKNLNLIHRYSTAPRIYCDYAWISHLLQIMLLIHMYHWLVRHVSTFLFLFQICYKHNCLSCWVMSVFIIQSASAFDLDCALANALCKEIGDTSSCLSSSCTCTHIQYLFKLDSFNILSFKMTSIAHAYTTCTHCHVEINTAKNAELYVNTRNILTLMHSEQLKNISLT